jgi:hypothetical protein
MRCACLHTLRGEKTSRQAHPRRCSKSLRAIVATFPGHGAVQAWVRTLGNASQPDGGVAGPRLSTLAASPSHGPGAMVRVQASSGCFCWGPGGLGPRESPGHRAGAETGPAFPPSMPPRRPAGHGRAGGPRRRAPASAGGAASTSPLSSAASPLANGSGRISPATRPAGPQAAEARDAPGHWHGSDGTLTRRRRHGLPSRRRPRTSPIVPPASGMIMLPLSDLQDPRLPFTSPDAGRRAAGVAHWHYKAQGLAGVTVASAGTGVPPPILAPGPLAWAWAHST